MTSRISRSLIAALLALTVVVGASGLAAAANTATISAEPSTPGDASTHTVTETVGSTLNTSSWNGFAVDYTNTSADVSNVSVADVQTIGIDRDGNSSGAAVDVNVSDDLEGVSVSNNGGTVTFSLGGSYSLYEGDEVVLVYGNVTNPDAGTHNVTADINPQSSGSEAVASLTIENATSENETTTSTSTTSTSTTSTTEETSTSTTSTTEETSTTTTETTTSTTEETSTSTSTTSTSTTSTAEETSTTTTESTEETSSGSSPGFGVGLTLVALAGAALVAARKR